VLGAVVSVERSLIGVALDHREGVGCRDGFLEAVLEDAGLSIARLDQPIRRAEKLLAGVGAYRQDSVDDDQSGSPLVGFRAVKGWNQDIPRDCAA
jgi:hypothetical protein